MSSVVFFVQMTLKMCLIGLITIPFCTGQQKDCSQKNISCADVRIQVHDGFNFSLDFCSEGTELSIEVKIDAKMIVIATALPRSHFFNYSAEVLHMDKYSVKFKKCQDFRLKCDIPAGEKHATEKCLDFKITSKPESQDLSDPPKPWVYICGVIILITIVLGLFCWGYMSWKKEVRRHQGAATPSFLQYLLTCSCLRPCTFLAERDDREIRNPEGTELQEVIRGDRETQQNGDVRIVIPHDRDPRGSGEAGEESTLGNGDVHSNDISAPKVNGESHHRALSRNPRDDDPGGANSNERKDGIRKIASGWAVGDHTAEDHETERLLTKKRAANPEFDVTGEATDLVNKPGFDQDQVSSCSVAPETDVESTHDMKNE